jgi:3-oxoacyl-[acyl-carrier protein] reductase
VKLAGQVAVVTGAGRGTGRAIAKMQAREGAKVALIARTAAEIEAVAEGINAAGGRRAPMRRHRRPRGDR